MIRAENAVPPKWSGNFLCKMHLNKITITALSKELGCRREYVSRLFNGHEIASDEKVLEIEKAINKLISQCASS